MPDDLAWATVIGFGAGVATGFTVAVVQVRRAWRATGRRL